MINTLLAAFIRLLARTRLPKIEGKIRLQNIEAPVDIIRDKWGVPHIYAKNQKDLLFAQGFVHAQDRLWQMDFNRRLVAGRLSEVLGEITIPLDRWMRTLTIRRVAEYESRNLSSELLPLLEAYTDGINQFITRGKLPIEFVLLKYKPERWKVADTLGWIKMMAWSLSVNWEAEIIRAHLIARLGSERAAELEPPHLARWPYIVPPGLDFNELDLGVLQKPLQSRPFTGPSPYEGLGSNNWVVSGDLTKSGKPLLANDMHLGLTTPAVWYENHLDCNGLMATGVTFPGIPGVVAGHNGRVAWGFTNAFPDVQDLYVERLRRQPDGSIEAEYDHQWEKVKVLDEVIKVRGAADVRHEVVVTRHGPIINDLAPEFCGDTSLSLQWTALDPDDFIRCVFEFWEAKTCDELNRALRNWTTPAQNVLCADDQGNIAYALAGKVPLRKQGNGRIPAPGWDSDYGWTTYLPPELLPRFKNPAQQYIVTANNRVFDETYPVAIDLEPITGDRAQRIVEMLLDQRLRQDGGKIDLDLCRRMHYDQCSPSARVVARYISNLTILESAHHAPTEVKSAINLMREWDGVLASDSAAALIYEAFIRKLIWMIFTARFGRLPPDVNIQDNSNPKEFPDEDSNLVANLIGKGPTAVIAETSLFGDRWLPWLTDKMKDPESSWFDLGNGENRDQAMLKALTAVIDDLKKELGPDMSQWSWGQYHQLTFNHPLGTNPVLGSIFNIGPFPIGGDNTTIWASGCHYHDLDSSNMIGPPFRMIIDFADLNQSIAVLAPGQSGNPASVYFRNQVEDWFSGVYHPMLIDQSEIKKTPHHHLRLLR